MDQAYKISKIIFELIVYTFVNYVVMKLRIILIPMTLSIFVHDKALEQFTVGFISLILKFTFDF